MKSSDQFIDLMKRDLFCDGFYYLIIEDTNNGFLSDNAGYHPPEFKLSSKEMLDTEYITKWFEVDMQLLKKSF